MVEMGQNRSDAFRCFQTVLVCWGTAQKMLYFVRAERFTECVIGVVTQLTVMI